MRDTEFFWDRMAERKAETIKALKDGVEPRIVRFAVLVTTGCNMACAYCNEKKKPFAMMERPFFEWLCRRAGQHGVIHISGGEPLIVPWLEDCITAWNGRARFALNSNLLIRPTDQTLGALFRVKTSLDDCEDDRWNDVVGGDFFETVVSNIRYVSERVRYTSVSYCATHQNAARLAGFLRFCRSSFPALYSTSVSFYKGSEPDLRLTTDDIAALFEQASALMDPTSWAVFRETHSKRGNLFPENLSIPCYLAMTERTYDPQGREYLCSHLYRDGVAAPGSPGNDMHCMTGCNQRFASFNAEVHRALQAVTA